MMILQKILNSSQGITVLGLKSAEAIFGAAMTIYFARVLGPDKFGYFAFGLAIVSLLAIPIKNGASTLVTKYVAQSGSIVAADEAGAYVATGMKLSLIYSIIAIILSWIVVLFVVSNNSFIFSIAVFSLALPFLTFTGLMEGVLRGSYRPNRSILVGTVFLPAMTILGALITFYFAERYSWHWAAGLYVLSAAFVSAISFVWARKQLFSLLSLRHTLSFEWRRWLHVTMPFMIVTGLLVFNRQIDIILLGLLATERDAGIYRLAAQAAILVTFGVQAIGHLYAPYLAAAVNQHSKSAISEYLRKSVGFSMTFGLGALVLLVLVGDDILLQLAGPDYLPGYPVMLVLCAANLAVAANGATLQAIYMQGHQRQATRIFAVTAVLSVLANTLLIYAFGMYGAAVATALAILFWSVRLRALACQTWGLSFMTLKDKSGA